jgi:hypothetical protein
MRVTKLLVLVCCCGLCGCAVKDFLTPESPPYDTEIAQSYYQTELKISTSADVLTTIHKPEYELLSQSKSVIASVGQKKKGREVWLNMVAFDENELTAMRKYFFVIDEKPKSLLMLIRPRRKLMFDSEMVLQADVLDKPYANENARRIAILKRVLENSRKDIKEVGPDNNMIVVCGMLINQSLEASLVELDSSPVLASGLSEPAGVEFSHITLDKGKIQMVVADDIVSIKIRVDSLVHPFGDPFSLED